MVFFLLGAKAHPRSVHMCTELPLAPDAVRRVSRLLKKTAEKLGPVSAQVRVKKMKRIRRHGAQFRRVAIMRRVAIIITIFCIFSFVGCTTTAVDLKQDPDSGSCIFTTDKNYQKVYRIASVFMKKHAHCSVESTIYPDVKRATISKGRTFDLGKQVFMVVEIEAKDKNKTSVKIYYQWTIGDGYKSQAYKLKKEITK